MFTHKQGNDGNPTTFIFSFFKIEMFLFFNTWSWSIRVIVTTKLSLRAAKGTKLEHEKNTIDADRKAWWSFDLISLWLLSCEGLVRPQNFRL